MKILAPFLIAWMLAGCQLWPTHASLRGEVYYLQRIALPANAVLSVTLADVSRADAPAVPLARYTGEPGAQVPIPFELSYDPRQVVPGHSYALTARIEAAGELLWINTERVPAALESNTSAQPRIRVQPAR